jgi:hypothetical protein
VLLWFGVANFRSIKERQLISLVAGKDAHLQQRNVLSIGKQPLQSLKSAVIYGANASGKSTVFLALELLRTLVAKSATGYQHGQPLPVTPFLLSSTTSKEPSEFEIAFIAGDGVRYEYGCALTSSRVHREWLVAYPNNRPQRWFVRDHFPAHQPFPDMVSEKLPGGEPAWKFGPSFEGDSAQQKLWQSATRDNALFLSTAIQFNNTQLQPVFEWLTQGLIVVSPGVNLNPWLSIDLLQSEHGRELVMELIRAADLGITRLQVEEISSEAKADDGLFPNNQFRLQIQHPPNVKLESALLRSAKVYAWHDTEDGSQVAFDIDLESDGTKKLFEFTGGIIRALQLGATLCIDELDRSLHPYITRFLVDLFHGPNNTHGAQLVFSTHDTTLMDQDLMRRDQIWFTEKNGGSTRIYPLSDYSPRKGEALERGYLKGRYGAVPVVGQMSKTE